MKALVTGGAGFIGRWTVAELLRRGHQVTALDNFSNSTPANVAEFRSHPGFRFVEGDHRDAGLLRELLAGTGTEVCWHLGASIVVQNSIDRPRETFDNDVVGTFEVLEACRAAGTRLVFMSTCMVYDRAQGGRPIAEEHPCVPRSPYAAAKLAGEMLVRSYYHAYGQPTVVVRPFNTYGPFQRSDGEGGVVSIFLHRTLQGQPLRIFGDGTQTRDLLYVEDCARFIIEAGLQPAAVGGLFNAGTGQDLSVNELAQAISRGRVPIEHVTHIHPQAEIAVLRSDARHAERVLGFRPAVSLEEGLRRTEAWVAQSLRAAQPRTATAP
ncbi:MAG: dTDP-glucose 4,6-dehydratase [Planctomycetota bacterium]